MAKFVHRDVSGGNCLYFDKDGDPRGIIADLEYTKLYGDITLNDHKMVCPDQDRQLTTHILPPGYP